MGCRACSSSIFMQKLGRCRRCMIQLAIASPLCWLIWELFYANRAHTVEAITLFVAACGTTLLLLAHLLRARQIHTQKKARH
ncbi:DUF3624 domain-containing protein [Photobacterium japonica]|uniref:DUF3624 domain-containing protein n=1 Tax=Photobacterium japonica TaxID=2910235 RepID=UPI003D118704